MDNIEMLRVFAGYIRDEICDIEKYAKLAVKWKDKRSDIAESFMNLSKQEAAHYQSLQDMRLKLVKYAADDEKGLNPEEIAILDYLKECELDAYVKAREYQDIYKDM